MNERWKKNSLKVCFLEYGHLQPHIPVLCANYYQSREPGDLLKNIAPTERLNIRLTCRILTPPKTETAFYPVTCKWSSPGNRLNMKEHSRIKQALERKRKFKMRKRTLSETNNAQKIFFLIFFQRNKGHPEISTVF